MNPVEIFNKRNSDFVERASKDEELTKLTNAWLCKANNYEYSYHYRWMGRPIIQYPQDIVAMQELIWSVKPDLIIETGIAHGGSLILSASCLMMLDYADAHEKGTVIDPRSPTRKAVGIDIDIRKHNREAIEAHPMFDRIEMIEGSSISTDVVAKVKQVAGGFERVLVFLDSNHTHDHVLAELEAYAPLTSVGSYCVVFDTVIENMPENSFKDRPWGKGDNPKTAVHEYMKRNDFFSVDKEIEDKLIITVAPGGFLKRVR